ncbi:RluA family pseudouridine synthase [Pediococcus ethanolidurans]|uniref:RluA family pseudouridine synthase n=1 Tax=Pediococcus ethanolidurans TaxID=319653 RepID=UPI001C1EDD63|nr:RluA family pseudouridine synthase [Pediococcus ethanolidurans]MBU7555582.1 RluA family pseudouridine synthase [Pediococcus ethanolidurans]MBU7563483.1 RluA family pseudouridine synthase [Pediococcus ethanolidurans]MCT4398424.1 RluA family pseudouridine synthase [Pediococcus ethanolidurans]MCV3314880.1 RluA family pseudouridine synthase [Pediococcus ethanolidurans]MCV3322223.1 RluA family pseudouridine synthase [Pediococcus ethanolidurans]
MKFNWQVNVESPEKLRTFLYQKGISRTLLKGIKFHGGSIELNHQPARVIETVVTGDVITLLLPPEVENDHVAVSNEPIEICYEDAHFLVVNKPAYLATVPSHLYSNDTLVNRVKGYYKRQNYESLVTHVVTRLDRETSGLVIFAKHHFAHSVLDKQLKRHAIKKIYLAVVEGHINQKHGLIDLPIAREEGSFIRRQVTSGEIGRRSLTEYWVVKSLKEATLLRVRLHTGRTHQIRVHFSALKHPLVGDVLYGGSCSGYMQRQALHCASISFFNPFLNQQITVWAPLPKDLAAYLKQESR